MKKAPMTLGGQGSGNFGHEGRPGEVGGSGGSGSDGKADWHIRMEKDVVKAKDASKDASVAMGMIRGHVTEGGRKAAMSRAIQAQTKAAKLHKVAAKLFGGSDMGDLKSFHFHDDKAKYHEDKARKLKEKLKTNQVTMDKDLARNGGASRAGEVW